MTIGFVHLMPYYRVPPDHFETPNLIAAALARRTSRAAIVRHESPAPVAAATAEFRW
jgi:hypothetical protein